MSEYERKRIDVDLRTFTSKHFEKPSQCKNPDDIRFYVKELSKKIEALEQTCNYAPDWAYSLLAQYNAKQNSILFVEFKNSYQ